MKKESFISHRSVNYHLQGNRDYDYHLKALKGIYSRSKRHEAAPRTAEIDYRRRNNENSFKLDSMNRQRMISLDNTKMLKNLRNITGRTNARVSAQEMSKNELYHDIKFQGKIIEKRRLFEKVQQENNKLAANIKKE